MVDQRGDVGQPRIVADDEQIAFLGEGVVALGVVVDELVAVELLERAAGALAGDLVA